MSTLYLLYSALHSHSTSMLKSNKLQSNSLFAAYFHSQQYIQGCPVHSHCHVLQYASHMRPHKCGPLSLLMQTQGWPTSPTPSNSHRLLRARFSVCGSLSSRTQQHVLVCVCVCSPTSSVPSHVQRVCTQFYLCALCSVSMLASRLHFIRYMHYIVFAPVH